MTIQTTLTEYIRAGYPALAVETTEEGRLERAACEVEQERGGEVWSWTATVGLVRRQPAPNGTGSHLEVGPLEVLDRIRIMGEQKEGTKDRLFLLYDFLYYLDGDPTLCRLFRDVTLRVKTYGDVLILAQPVVSLPVQIREAVTLIELPLPGPEELGHVLDVVAEGTPMTSAERDSVLESSKGLTCWAAENAYALSLVRKGQVVPEVVAKEKAGVIKKSGLLTLYEPAPTDTMDHLGGLNAFKDWLLMRKGAFGPAAREFGLEVPKGVLAVGVPGCGKSAMAKATALAYRRPLLRLDMGTLFNSLVGESEANQRQAIQLAEAVAPCVLWLDEIEKACAGAQNGMDSGVGARMLGNLLYWMQEKTSPVFVFATSNDVSALPPELLRKGRFDELFFVDLPSIVERETILGLHLQKRGRDPEAFDLARHAKNSVNFSGAELEGCVKEALFAAFSHGRDVQDDDLAEALAATVPLAKTATEKLDSLRAWACGRARPATTFTTAPPRSFTTGRRQVEKRS
jgi:hypothetical protein